MWSKYLHQAVVQGILIEVVEHENGLSICFSDPENQEFGESYGLLLNKEMADAIVDALCKAACAQLEPPKKNNLVVYEESDR